MAGKRGAPQPKRHPARHDYTLTIEEQLPENQWPTLFFGIVAPIGTPRQLVKSHLAKALHAVGYQPLEVRLSELLRETESWHPVQDEMKKIWKSTPHEVAEHDKRMSLLMALGNEVRRATDEQRVLAILGALAARDFEADMRDGVRRAFVFDQLKRPEEIQALQEIYQRRFHLIGCSSPESERIANLSEKIAKSYNSSRPDFYLAQAHELALRDLFEEGDDYGQNVRGTYSMADVFVSLEPNKERDTFWQIERYVQLLFCHQFLTPTRDEQGMQAAHSAALNSADLARQVGAAICTTDGSCLAVGWNEVPKAGGGVYWPSILDQEHDARDSRGKNDPMGASRLRVLTEILNELKGQEWLTTELISGRSLEELINSLVRENVTLQRRVTELIAESFASISTEEAWSKQKKKLQEILEPVCRTNEARKIREEFVQFLDLVRQERKGVGYANYLLKKLLKAPLADSEIMNINEFGRTVHAELVAITDAARRGVALAGATLFSTTFPCHECARHIVAAGIDRVVYVQPYPKSYAKESHNDSIQVDDLTKFTLRSKVRFEPFVGVGPRRYLELFQYNKNLFRRKSADGSVAVWRPKSPRYSEPEVVYQWRTEKYVQGLAASSGFEIEIDDSKRFIREMTM